MQKFFTQIVPSILKLMRCIFFVNRSSRHHFQSGDNPQKILRVDISQVVMERPTATNCQRRRDIEIPGHLL